MLRLKQLWLLVQRCVCLPPRAVYIRWRCVHYSIARELYFNTDCTYNTKDFACGKTAEGNEPSDLCKGACSGGARSGRLYSFDKSSVRFPESKGMTKDIAEAMCYASKLDVQFIENSNRQSLKLGWQ